MILAALGIDAEGKKQRARRPRGRDGERDGVHGTAGRPARARDANGPGRRSPCSTARRHSRSRCCEVFGGRRADPALPGAQGRATSSTSCPRISARRCARHCARRMGCGKHAVRSEATAQQPRASSARRSPRSASSSPSTRDLDETLTVMRLRLPRALERTLCTTNAVENLIGSVRGLGRRQVKSAGATVG